MFKNIVIVILLAMLLLPKAEAKNYDRLASGYRLLSEISQIRSFVTIDSEYEFGVYHNTSIIVTPESKVIIDKFLTDLENLTKKKIEQEEQEKEPQKTSLKDMELINISTPGVIEYKVYDGRISTTK